MESGERRSEMGKTVIRVVCFQKQGLQHHAVSGFYPKDAATANLYTGGLERISHAIKCTIYTGMC